MVDLNVWWVLLHITAHNDGSTTKQLSLHKQTNIIQNMTKNIFLLVSSFIIEQLWKKVIIRTDKKENQIFLTYKENLDWSSCKVIYEEGLPVYEEMRKYLTIYEEAVSHIRMILQPLHSEFLWMKICFLFYQCDTFVEFEKFNFLTQPFRDVKGKVDGKRSCDLAFWSWSFTKWRIDYFTVFANYCL